MVKAFNYRPKDERICHRGHVITRGGHRLTSGRPNFLGCRECRKIEKITFAEKHPLAYIWGNIKKRCYNPNNPKYKDYGGRGIKMCEAWLSSYEQFAKDMGPRPSLRHSIERKDNNGDYCPENCQWETSRKQGLNKRNNRRINFNGQTLTAREWSELTGIKTTTIEARLKSGWPIDDALTWPARKKVSS